MTRKILLVDDSLEELKALRQMFGEMVPDWHIACSSSGTDGLAQIAETDFDAVIADFMMPEMDGEQFLAEVQKKSPKTLRVMLSGNYDIRAASRSMKVVHQYFCKPCPPLDLLETISQVLTYRDVLNSSHLQRLVSQITTLPSLPSLCHELLEELKSEDPSVPKIVDIISRDLGISAKIIQLANSGFFGLPYRVASLQDAILYVGLETVKSLVISFQLFSLFDRTDLARYSLNRLWNHSWQVALTAKRMAQIEGLKNRTVEQAFLAGLLHDVGKLILCTGVPSQFGRVLALQREKNISPARAEQEIFGCTHAEVGAYLLGLWGFPKAVVEAVACHHAPTRNPHRHLTEVTLVHVADSLVNTLMQDSYSSHPVEMDVEYLNRIGVSDRLPLWSEQIASLFYAQEPA